MSVSSTLMVVLIFVLTPLDPIRAAVELDTDCRATDALAKVSIPLLRMQSHNDIINLKIDIDECTETSAGCGQVCSNTIGSYNCGCRSGYRLDSDGHTCNGIAQYNYCVQFL
jgi:hypothetical protein